MLLIEAAHFYSIMGTPAAQRKDAIRAALYDGSFSRGQKREWGIDLADHYLAECRYDSALFILDYSRRIPERVQRCFAPSSYAVRYRHRAALALEGLGKIDSAISMFAPVAFLAKGSLSWTSLPENVYDKMIADFVRILQRRYSLSELSAAADQLAKESRFDTVVDERGGVSTKFVHQFLGKAYPGNSLFFSFQMTESTEVNLSGQLRNSLLYQLLRGLNTAVPVPISTN